MKKFVYISIISLLYSFGVKCNIFAQEVNSFKSERAHLSFVYPSTYKKIKITAAPHMLIHLDNGTEEYVVSCWELGTDESVDAWNEMYFQNLEQNAKKAKTGPKLLSCKKTTLSLKGKTIRASELIHSRGSGIATMYVITYQFFWKGNMIQIMYTNHGLFTQKAKKGEEIIKSIQLQN